MKTNSYESTTHLKSVVISLQIAKDEQEPQTVKLAQTLCPLAYQILKFSNGTRFFSCELIFVLV